uniref:Uncharacterized protein n=1 Tax=Nelumbo nucifera TaxID=4432 RepID=A0A822YF43_NELNU|nr:TPA_asm: hypothetical protein HUJ06_029616 [Nelumbo nucifera]
MVTHHHRFKCKRAQAADGSRKAVLYQALISRTAHRPQQALIHDQLGIIIF